MLDSCKMVEKQSEAFHTFLWHHFFPSLKQNFIAYRSSKVSSRPDCIFEIHQLWQSGFSRVYSNCCCSCSFESEIIKIGQSSCCIATYIHKYKYKQKHNQTQWRTSMNERTHFFIKISSLTLYSRKGDVCCVCELSWRRGQTVILTQSSSFDHSSTSSSSWQELLHRGSLRAQSPLSAAGSQFGILSPTDSSRLSPGYIIVWRPPASDVLPFIYTGASLDWRLGRRSICYNLIRCIAITNWIFKSLRQF